MNREGITPDTGGSGPVRLAPREGPRRPPQRIKRRDLGRALAGERRGAPESPDRPREASRRREAPALLVALDSEGTVLDSMRPRHELCYAPAFAASFGEGVPAESMMEVWRFVSLESRLRDANRFKALAAALRMAARRPELASRLRREERLAAALEAWLASESSCSGAKLEADLDRGRVDRRLAKALEWSKAVDGALRRLSAPRPFAGALAALPSIASTASILVLARSSADAARREWEAAGIAAYASRFMGGELGGKAACLAAAASELGAARVLVVGDALGDLEAARRAGAAFFPIEPGDEDSSWAELASAYLPRFAAGEAPRGPLAAFLAALPSSPPWR